MNSIVSNSGPKLQQGISILHRIIILVVGILPLGFIIPILAFYFHAALVLGHLPSYDMPDPKEFLFYSLYAPIVELGLIFWGPSLVVFLIVVLTHIFMPLKNVKWKHVLICSVGHAIAIWIIFGGIFEWVVD